MQAVEEKRNSAKKQSSPKQAGTPPTEATVTSPKQAKASDKAVTTSTGGEVLNIQAPPPSDEVILFGVPGPIIQEVTKPVPTHYAKLRLIDIGENVEQKNGLSYLSWAWAWDELMKRYPDASYTIRRFGEQQLPYVFDRNTGYMVFTEVTLEGVTREMWLPVMDGANKAMKDHPYEYTTRFGTKTVDAADMFDINKAIMRCLVKNISMFGLGLYIYAGEDLPPEEEKPKTKAEIAFDEALDAVDSIAKRMAAGFTGKQKIAWLTEHVTPIVGSMNYREVKDIKVLKKLEAYLGELEKKGEKTDA